jgi:plastocyanin
MKFSSVVIVLVLLLATSVWSIKFSTTDLERIDIYYKSLQIGYAYADVLGSNDSSTTGSETDVQPPDENVGNQCAPDDPSCGTPGSGGGQCAPDDLGCLGGTPGSGGGQCAPDDPSCGTPGSGGGQCAPDDLVCLGGGTGGGGSCAPDDLVCLGGGTGGTPPLDEKSGGLGACFDGIDNDGDGKIDQEDTIDCGGGGPPVTTVPGGAGSIPPGNNPSQVGDRNTGNDQFSGGIVPVSRNGNGPPTILASALESTILPGGAEATLPREDICNDGVDNDHNGLKDSEDPSCGMSEKSEVVFNGPQLNIEAINSLKVNENHVVIQAENTGANPLITQNNNTSVILISSGSKHDIRTISSFHYQYSPQKITVEKGSKVMWINRDATDFHEINVIDNKSGKTIFSYPSIRFGTSVYYNFDHVGSYTFSDPKYPSMTGQITVLN